VVLSDLAEFVNFVTRVKIVPAVADNVAFSETERQRAREFATKLSIRVLSRMWQMLLKGIAEAQAATRPAAAAEMVLIRIAYVADMPTPDEAIKMLEQNGGNSPAVPSPSSARTASAAAGPSTAAMPPLSPPAARALEPSMRPQASVRAQMAPAAPAPDFRSAPALRITSFAQIVALAGEKRDLLTKSALEADVRLVRIEDGRLELALEPNAARTLVADLSRKLEQWTGRRWTVIVSNEQGHATLRAQSQAEKNHRERAAEADPRVKEVLTRFPGAKVIEVRKLAPEPPESNISADGLDSELSDGEEL
jgi:DNA polymerase-3 subunit gamma/tau